MPLTGSGQWDNGVGIIEEPRGWHNRMALLGSAEAIPGSALAGAGTGLSADRVRPAGSPSCRGCAASGQARSWCSPGLLEIKSRSPPSHHVPRLSPSAFLALSHPSFPEAAADSRKRPTVRLTHHVAGLFPLSHRTSIHSFEHFHYSALEVCCKILAGMMLISVIANTSGCPK